jgi:hypothetical protein
VFAGLGETELRVKRSDAVDFTGGYLGEFCNFIHYIRGDVAIELLYLLENRDQKTSITFGESN